MKLTDNSVFSQNMCNHALSKFPGYNAKCRVKRDTTQNIP